MLEAELGRKICDVDVPDGIVPLAVPAVVVPDAVRSERLLEPAGTEPGVEVSTTVLKIELDEIPCEDELLGGVPLPIADPEVVLKDRDVEGWLRLAAVDTGVEGGRVLATETGGLLDELEITVVRELVAADVNIPRAVSQAKPRGA